MTTNELIERVRVKLEEHTPFASNAMIAAPESMGFEVKPIKSYIEATLEEAVNEVLMTLPLSLLRSDPLNVVSHANFDDGEGYVELGSDFLRVYTFKLAGWHKILHEAVSEDSATAELQTNQFTRGGFHKPVLVYKRMGSRQFLYYYSWDNVAIEPTSEPFAELVLGEQVSRYILPSNFDDDVLQDSLIEFFATNCAKKVYGIFGMTDKATVMDGLLKELVASYS